MPGLLSLFGRGRSDIASTGEATLFPGNETLEVVGESLHQSTLWEIVGGFRRVPVRHSCAAVLKPEPDNPVDPHAVRVLVDGRQVGYLARDDAAVYLPGCVDSSPPVKRAVSNWKDRSSAAGNVATASASLASSSITTQRTSA